MNVKLEGINVDAAGIHKPARTYYSINLNCTAVGTVLKDTEERRFTWTIGKHLL